MNPTLKKILVGEFTIRRMLISLISVSVVLYLGLGLYAYFLSEHMIFQPQLPLAARIENEIRLDSPSGEKVSAKFYKNPAAEFTILFSHGNAEDLFNSDSFFQKLSDSGFNVLAYDYRGYGLSGGKPSEANAYENAQTAYSYLTNQLKIPAEKIILHGRSLGSAMAIDLATKQHCGGLIVESGFVSAFRVMTRVPVFPFDKFNNLRKISSLKCPVFFIHGKQDRLIPIWHGELLFANASEPKFSYWVENAGHNDVLDTAGKTYFDRIHKFADSLR